MKQPYPSELAAKIMLRMPQDRYDELKERAKGAYRSMNGEILMLIDRGLAAEKTASEHQA